MGVAPKPPSDPSEISRGFLWSGSSCPGHNISQCLSLVDLSHEDGVGPARFRLTSMKF